MKLIIVRHGETDHNVSGIVMGHAPVPLNARGEQQAERAAERLRQEKIQAIYSSDLPRAKATAEYIARHHPEAVFHVTSELRERSLGVHEGQHRDTLKPARERSGQPFHEWKPAEGESMLELQQRAATWFKAVTKQHHGDCVVVVSHGGFIYALLTHLFHGQDFSFRPEYRHHNTGLTILNVQENGTVEIEQLNDTTHLHGDEDLLMPSE